MRLRCFAAGFAGALACLIGFGFLAASAVPAAAGLVIRIDKAAQQMTVEADGETIHVWPVSTGIAKYDTPNGAYQPFRMEKDHFSREWDDAPMPFSIFFTTKGHAIHGTYHKSLGKPASHGCVRLSVQNAGTLWALVRRYKMANTAVVLTGEIPPPEPAVAHAAPPAKPAPRAAAVAGDDITGAVPLSARDRRRIEREARRWREQRQGERYTYYDRRYDERAPRYYVERPRQPRRIYDRYGGWVYADPQPFPFFFGR